MLEKLYLLRKRVHPDMKSFIPSLATARTEDTLCLRRNLLGCSLVQRTKERLYKESQRQAAMFIGSTVSVVKARGKPLGSEAAHLEVSWTFMCQEELYANAVAGWENSLFGNHEANK